MIYLSLSEELCFCLFPKVASTSIQHELNKTHRLLIKQVDANEAKKHKRVVAFVRDPIERLKSCFNHLWHLTLNNVGYKSIMDQDIITAYGGVLRNEKRANLALWSKRAELRYIEAVKKAKFNGIPENEISNKFDIEDYRRFIDYVLSSVACNEHWMPQSELCSNDNLMIANEFYKFEDINEVYKKLIDSCLPVSNNFPEVFKDEGYRIEDVKQFYKKDYELRELCLSL